MNTNHFQNLLLDEVVLESELKTKYNRRDYLRLKRRVIKVYPYVDSIKQIMLLADNDLQNFSKKRHSRRYTRKLQKQLMNRFRKSIMKLSRKEGVVLSKLIYREFDITAHHIISNYRGSFHAFWWQQLSKLYNGNLKSTFDVRHSKEDVLIEYILQQHVVK